MPQNPIHTAFQLLNRLDYRHCFYLELQCESVFQDDYLLQFTWVGQHLIWQKTTYLKYEHSPIWRLWKNSETRPVMQYNSKEEEEILFFYREVGESYDSDFQSIIQPLKTLKVESCYLNRGDGRDGEQFTLCLGESSTFAEMSLSWWTCAVPETWKPLENVVSQLQAFAKKIEPDERAFFKLIQTTETNNHGLSVLWNCEEIG